MNWKTYKVFALYGLREGIRFFMGYFTPAIKVKKIEEYIEYKKQFSAIDGFVLLEDTCDISHTYKIAQQNTKWINGGSFVAFSIF